MAPAIFRIPLALIAIATGCAVGEADDLVVDVAAMSLDAPGADDAPARGPNVFYLPGPTTPDIEYDPGDGASRYRPGDLTVEEHRALDMAAEDLGKGGTDDGRETVVFAVPSEAGAGDQSDFGKGGADDGPVDKVTIYGIAHASVSKDDEKDTADDDDADDDNDSEDDISSRAVEAESEPHALEVYEIMELSRGHKPE